MSLCCERRPVRAPTARGRRQSPSATIDGQWPPPTPPVLADRAARTNRASPPVRCTGTRADVCARSADPRPPCGRRCPGRSASPAAARPAWPTRTAHGRPPIAPARRARPDAAVIRPGSSSVAPSSRAAAPPRSTPCYRAVQSPSSGRDVGRGAQAVGQPPALAQRAELARAPRRRQRASPRGRLRSRRGAASASRRRAAHGRRWAARLLRSCAAALPCWSNTADDRAQQPGDPDWSTSRRAAAPQGRRRRRRPARSGTRTVMSSARERLGDGPQARVGLPGHREGLARPTPPCPCRCRAAAP